MTTAIEVAKYLLAHQDASKGEPISNLKLQKLLYYAQGCHLALFGVPLFPDTVEAWDLGPVVGKVYRAYSSFGANAITAPDRPPVAFPATAKEVMDGVLANYGQYSAVQLANMTHAEKPWRAGKATGQVSDDDMVEYFRGVVVKSARSLSCEELGRNAEFMAALTRAKTDVAQGRRTRWGGPKPSQPSI